MSRIPLCVPIVIVISLLAAKACAQSVFLEKDQPGGLVSFQYQHGDEFYALAGSLGYSPMGFFDVGLEVGRTYIDTRDVTYTAYTPYAGINLLKPNEDMSVGFLLQGGYEMGSFDADYLDLFNAEKKGRGLIVGAFVYGRFGEASGTAVYPRAGLLHANIEVETKDSMGDVTKLTHENTVMRLGFTACVKGRFTMGIGLDFDDGETASHIGVGLLI